MRTRFSIAVLAAFIPVSLAAQQKPAAISLAGGWTRNADLSDASDGRGAAGGDRGEGAGGRRRGGGGGGGFGGGGGRRGGFGGGGGRGGGMGRGDAGSATPEEMMRMRDAMRGIVAPSDHLVITQSDSMIVITGGDGRTTRLSPDGKKIKDDNTKIERKTKWDGGKLVSEISGLAAGKMTQTFTIDPEARQLRIVVVIEAGHSSQPRTITHVYDADVR